jgi:hypothetical protein
MKQETAKSPEQVLRWIETHDHHYGSWDDEVGFFILRGAGHKLRIPDDVQKQTQGLVEPSKDQFDSRMFRANSKGRSLLRKSLPAKHVEEHR